MSENHPNAARIFATRQGSADDAGQEGPLGSTGKMAGRPKGGFAKQSAEGADAGLWQKDRRGGVVFGHNDYSSKKAIFGAHHRRTLSLVDALPAIEQFQ